MELQFSDRSYPRDSGDGNIPKCLGCAARTSPTSVLCNRIGGFGCDHCLERGLVCLIPNPDDDENQPRTIALPPFPGRLPGRRPKLIKCGRSNCFWRGLPSSNFHGYYLSLGYGPSGVNDPAAVVDYRQPPDYHLQYASAVLNLHNAGEEGEKKPPPVPMVAMNPHKARYQAFLEAANDALTRGIPIKMEPIFNQLLADMNAWKPIEQCQAVAELTLYIQQEEGRKSQRRIRDKPIEYPNGTDFELLRNLNAGRSFQGGIAPIFKVTPVPVDRPASPGPPKPFFEPPAGVQWQQLGVEENAHLFPPGHPEVTDMTKVRFPPPLHPSPLARSPLATIPYDRMWADGLQYAAEQYCHNISPPPVVLTCTTLTRKGCEDTTHYEEGHPVCDRCERANRKRFMDQFDSMALTMRAYSCHACLNDPATLQKFQSSGYRIWWDNPPYTADDEPQIRPERPSFRQAGGHDVGGMMGAPLNVTGCSCATKLFGRRICSPHRLQYMLDMHEKVQSMRDYIVTTYGKMVCPFCCRRAGADAYGFQGEEGCEGRPKAYVCLCCHGVVIDGRTNASGKFQDNFLNSVTAPAPYNPVREEDVKPIELKRPRSEEEAFAWAFDPANPDGPPQDGNFPIVVPIKVEKKTTSGTVVAPFERNPNLY
ncbi:hypothetical protein F5X96DRAFT_695741 [Biscogniauxia mediterranea]|nr:hypothetical protein F5X96DRAFT_695741 [Biscogniauxia mediterranea]